MGIRAQIQIQVQGKVPQIIDPEQIIRLELPGEKLEKTETTGGALHVASRTAEGKLVHRLLIFGGPVGSPISWSDGSGSVVIARRSA